MKPCNFNSKEIIDMAFCTKCGTQLPDGATFCTTCGAALEQAAPAPAPQPQMQPQMQPQQPQMQPQQPQMQQPQMQQPQYQQMPQQFAQQPYPQMQYAKPNLADHTAEFNKDDVKKFKFAAAIMYLAVAGMFFVTNDGIGIVTMFQNLIKSASNLIFGGAAVGTSSYIAMGTGTLLLCLTAGLAPNEYLRFHATQAAKLMMCVLLLSFVSLIPVVGPVVCYLGIWVTTVFGFIGLVQTIRGKSVEPFIVRFFK